MAELYDREKEKKRILLLFLKKNRIYSDYIKNIRYNTDINSFVIYTPLIHLFSCFFLFDEAKYPRYSKINTTTEKYWEEWNRRYINWVKNKKYRNYFEPEYF